MEKVGELWQNVVNTDKFCLLDPDLHFECGSRSRQWFECGSGSETLVFKFTSITRQHYFGRYWYLPEFLFLVLVRYLSQLGHIFGTTNTYIPYIFAYHYHSCSYDLCYLFGTVGSGYVGIGTGIFLNGMWVLPLFMYRGYLFFMSGTGTERVPTLMIYQGAKCLKFLVFCRLLGEPETLHEFAVPDPRVKQPEQPEAAAPGPSARLLLPPSRIRHFNRWVTRYQQLLLWAPKEVSPYQHAEKALKFFSFQFFILFLGTLLKSVAKDQVLQLG